jgi:hypothetical protein
MLVKNLKKIKQRFSVVTLHLTNKIVNKNDNLRKDALKFLLASLLIAFSIDVVLTKLSDKPIWDYAGYIPGIDPILDFVNINESSVQILNLTSQFLNPFPSDQPSAITDFDDNLTTQSIKPFIDISVGAFTLFFLRQFIYRNRYVERTVIPKNPGSRLLLLFLIAAGILFIIDIVQDISYSFMSLRNFDLMRSLYESQFHHFLKVYQRNQ